MEYWMLIEGISLAFSLPVLISSYYNVILFVNLFRYPPSLSETLSVGRTPLVSVLIATYNERFVLERTLDTLRDLKYPRDKLQVIIADDSTDETVAIIDEKVRQLNNLGINSIVSRREDRSGFKSGALNKAVPLLQGEYVLLLDADSIVTPDVVTKGLGVFGQDPKVGFVSYRVGHYNREQNMITKLFALQLDQGDTLVKMGSYPINAPFSFQGGFTLLSTEVLRRVSYWKDSIVEDADLSCRVYAAGYRGVYLSDVRIFGEDPTSLAIWKRQAARVSQGWAKCVLSNGKEILHSPDLSFWRKIALLLLLTSPFAGVSWIVVTFASALGLTLGLTAPASSIFSNPIYVGLVTLPLFAFFASGAFALRVQRMMNLKNLVLLPLISYTASCMVTITSIGFLNGLRGRRGFFFRTPKFGLCKNPQGEYSLKAQLDGTSSVEVLFAVSAVALSLLVFQRGVWFLGLSLLGFGVLTLKSMNLSRIILGQKQ